MRRYLRFLEAWLKLSCAGFIVILLVVLAANIIW